MSQPSRQATIGLALSTLIFGAWLAIQAVALLNLDIAQIHPLLIVTMVALLCWLDVGLFIIAHDAMHGSLAPGWPDLNRIVGRIVLAAYAGFSFDRILPKHMAHHRAPGTSDDPDFHVRAPQNFLRWYFAFFREYFGWRELAALTLAVILLTQVAGVPHANLLLFWALPAILSSLQLFLFGTFLPHAHRGGSFIDDHRTRSSNYGWLASLMTCYHFGYHHEHHLYPHLPWWRLPSAWRRG